MSHFEPILSNYVCEVSCDYEALHPLHSATMFINSLRQSSQWNIKVIDTLTGKAYNVNLQTQQVTDL